MFSDDAKRGNMISIDILDNGYVVTFTVVENGKCETKRWVTQDISEVITYVKHFNQLPKL